jgi:hypothetical protein
VHRLSGDQWAQRPFRNGCQSTSQCIIGLMEVLWKAEGQQQLLGHAGLAWARAMRP